ncbi:uncharacterized protein LOC121980163 [Zingiber officinale]|uniref:uncharacterized protein LOC121980163 n=1 Tax=Zingiber officinale TaxID=94328 RepID=UPI001C4AC3FE|nr:uncharacterized protein LOC121980163 [Zingiber officinale]
MPFGLKNAKATYQRLVNRVFRKQIGQNFEVYLDDILIKSLRSTNLCADIEETFQMLRTYGVKLNPQKCLFGAKGGRFLGYIITEHGIEANPSKVKALQDMPPPRNLKEWDEECDRAFEALKVYLNSLPVLAKPIISELLRLYLSSTEHVVGSALVRSDGGEQPVYFLSHILKDVESRYTGLEKLAFTLVLAAQRLRPYFLAHTIIYQPRAAIKAQSLADFITEVRNPEPAALWKIFVDGSSTRLGSGIGILLLSPQEERMHLAVRLDYRATNNEAEYEALIAGLQAARHVGVGRVALYSDSQLAAQQLSGAFEINNTRLKLYADAFEKLKANFEEVVIQKAPRTENHMADELAKLASSISLIVIQQPIEHVSLVAHIDRMEGLTFPSDWRTCIMEFLRSGTTPPDREEAQVLRRRASRFTLKGDQLYKKAFSRPLLKCVSSEDAEYILEEVHQGSCGGHLGGRSLASKIL